MLLHKRQAIIDKKNLLIEIIIFALPIIAMDILQLLFNTADMVVVGRFSGSESFAAVGATGTLINMIIKLFIGLSVGASVAIARDYGANNQDGMSKSVHTSIAVSIISGFLVMFIGLVFCKPLLSLMGTPLNIIDMSVLYMKIYFFGMPAMMIYNFSAAILRAVGDSRRPMYFLVASGIVNVILNLFFVIVLKMGVAGVALATVISQYLSAFLIIFSLSKNEKAIRFSPKKLRIHIQKLKDIIKIGIPAGIQSVLFALSSVLIQSSVNSFGSTMVAANSASRNIEDFIDTPLNSYYNSAITFTGQSMGAKNYNRIDDIAKVYTVLIFISWIFLGGIPFLFGKSLLGIYTSDPNVANIGIQRLYILVIPYFIKGIMMVFPGLNRGMGFSVLPMLITLIGVSLMRIVWLTTFFAWYPTPIMLYLCYPVTWVFASLGQIGVFFYARHKIRKQDNLLNTKTALI